MTTRNKKPKRKLTAVKIRASKDGKSFRIEYSSAALCKLARLPRSQDPMAQ